MKPVCMYLHMVLFVVNEIWKSARTLPVATFGSERVKIVLLWARMVNVLIESELSRILPAPLREKSGLNVFALTPRED